MKTLSLARTKYFQRKIGKNYPIESALLLTVLALTIQIIPIHDFEKGMTRQRSCSAPDLEEKSH
jgi:hypothetical protein